MQLHSILMILLGILMDHFIYTILSNTHFYVINDLIMSNC